MCLVFFRGPTGNRHRWSTASLRRVFALVLFACLEVASLAHAQEPQLTAPDARITDEAQYHDQTVYQVLEQRLEGLNNRGHRLSEYDMAKAQCWVDVSFHEYTRNDRSDFPAAAIEQAEAIIEQLENNALPASRDTPLIDAATRLRPDLWARLDALKHSAQMPCSAQAVACAEVELVHAGHEAHDFDWQHANPYIELAENLTAEADDAAQHCEAPAPAAPAAPSVVAQAAPVQTKARVILHADTLFPFGRADLASLSTEGRAQLDTLIDRMPRDQPMDGMVVVGYTDRIDVHHQPENNQRLSEARAKTVADYLAAHGVEGAKITSYGRGSADPLVQCQDVKDKQALYRCLAPNRRVEVVVTFGRAQ